MNDAHDFLGHDHAEAERRSRAVVVLCAVMMTLEIAGGWWWGSIALVADGLHMATHAGALALAAAAYALARRHADDPRFSFGTGKLGDLAGYTSAVMLACIALLIGVEAAQRLFDPLPIRFGEAIPIACLGLAVNVASAWLLAGGHSHDHAHGNAHGHSPHGSHGHAHAHDHAAATGRDNNFRAAVAHVMMDAAVSVLVIGALVVARATGWLWADPVAGLVGAAVIVSWAWTLCRDAGAVLLDMTPDRRLAQDIRGALEAEGCHVHDFHLWRLGPGHLGLIASVDTAGNATSLRARLRPFPALSHVTIEVRETA